MTSTAAGARASTASTASTERSGRDRTEPAEPLLSLVRGWPWAIPLVLAGFVLRIVAVLGEVLKSCRCLVLTLAIRN